MQARRVVITGMGCVSAAGLGADALWQSVRAGDSRAVEVCFQRPFRNRVKIAAQLKDFEPGDHVTASELMFCDRYAQFALVAAEEAVRQAGFANGHAFGGRTAVIIGTGIGGATTIDDKHFEFYTTDNRADPAIVPRTMPNSATSQVSMRYGCTGPSFAVSSACSSATQAIGLAAWMIRTGIVDNALAGGSEALITPSIFRAWEALRVLTPDACRPFSKHRNGMVLGEGAGVFVLESAEAAERRGVEPLVALTGYGTTSDAKDIVRPDVEGAAGSMRLALEDARLEPGDIDYVNAHGTGTIMNDVTETQALQQVFGKHLDRLAVSSTKPVHGHGLGAAGALELIATIMAVRDGIAPPTINWLETDPKCLPDPVPNEARPMKIGKAMSNSFAFGGINAVLVVEQA